MKNILIALTFILFSCNSLAPIQKDQIIVTTKYAGRLIKYDHVLIKQVFLKDLRTTKKCTIILTSKEFIRVKGHIEIQDSVLCYIRIEPCRRDVHRCIARKLEPWYFTWLGTDEEYKIIK